MFGRRHSSDPDVVAAARRRLAALAAESPPSVVDSTSAGERLAPPRSDFDTDSEEPTTAARPVAHHAALRQSALARLGVSAQQITVTALLVVALVVGVAWWALRSVPAAHPVPMSSQRQVAFDASPGPPSSPANTTPPSSAGGAAVGGPGSTPAATMLVVDVAGKVRRPGIVELPPGSRVVDAIAAAGGARPGVSLTSLNLARLLVDGEQIVVGVEAPVEGGTDAMSGGQSTAGVGGINPVDLNTATAEQLDTLPDVGPVTAQAILQWRSDNGPFTSVDDLLDVSGIGEATMADIRPYVYV